MSCWDTRTTKRATKPISDERTTDGHRLTQIESKRNSTFAVKNQMRSRLNNLNSVVFLSASICVHLWFNLPADAQPTPVVKPGGFIQHLTWSPDGKKFLFTRIHAGKMGLWTVNIDGAELTQLLPKAN